MSDPFDADQDIERIRAAVDSVKRELRGLPQATAVERLEAAFHRHEVFLPPESMEVLARAMSRPGWPLRHPLQALRQRRQSQGCPDPESHGFEHEVDELTRKLDDILDSEAVAFWSISSRRTFDGTVQVIAIRPWSDALADRIRAQAAPISVIVEAAERDDPDPPSAS